MIVHMILFLHSQNLMAHAKVIQAYVAQDHVYSIPVNQKMSVFNSLTGGFLLLQNFCVAISVSPHVCFILVLILISMFLR